MRADARLLAAQLFPRRLRLWAIAGQRILITGGAGLIGSHLCAALVAQGHAVTCLDDFSTGTAGNIGGLVGHDRCTVLRQDVRAPIDREVDAIYNLACPASPAAYLADPDRAAQVSLLGAINLLGLARRCAAPVFHASTSEVYGAAEVHPQVETYRGAVDPTGPRACYAEAKRGAETLCFTHHRQYGVAIRVARIFNTYGPGLRPDDGRVVSNFIVAALQGRPLTIDGDGMQTRSFCYVDDLVAGIVLMMATGDAATGPINLGNPDEIAIGDLARLVLDITGSRSLLHFGAGPAGDVIRRQPDIARARDLLNWQPATTLRDGLAATIAWFDDLLARSDAPVD